MHLSRIAIVGHGGSGFGGLVSTYPVNSMSSIRHALETIGCHGVEVDVQFTSDKVPVLYHGNDLNDLTNTGGPVCNYTFQELGTCFYNHHLHPGSGEKILSLNEWLQAAKKYPPSLILMFDLKLARHCLQPYGTIFEWGDLTGAMITETVPANHCIVISNDVNFLSRIKLKYPQIEVFYYASDGFESGFKKATSFLLDGMVIHLSKVNSSQVRKAQASGLWVTLFGVRSYQEHIRAFGMSPEIVESDNPALAMGILEKARISN